MGFEHMGLIKARKYVLYLAYYKDLGSRVTYLTKIVAVLEWYAV